jgi:Protein of unknown function (DUF3489)
MNTATESEKNASASAPEVPPPKTKRTTAKKAQPMKKAPRAKKTAGKPKAARANKKAEVVALMKRAKGATLAEIMAATKWQAQSVSGRMTVVSRRQRNWRSRERRFLMAARCC